MVYEHIYFWAFCVGMFKIWLGKFKSQVFIVGGGGGGPLCSDPALNPQPFKRHPKIKTRSHFY